MNDRENTNAFDERSAGSLNRATNASYGRRSRILHYQKTRMDAQKQLRLASEHLTRGEHDDAMSSCRSAAELLLATFGESDSDYVSACEMIYQIEGRGDFPTISDSLLDTVVVQTTEATRNDLKLDYRSTSAKSVDEPAEREQAKAFRRQLELMDTLEVPKIKCRRDSRLSLMRCRIWLAVCTRFGAEWWTLMRSSNPTVRAHARSRFIRSNSWANGIERKELANCFANDLARLCVYEPAFFDKWFKTHGCIDETEILEKMLDGLEYNRPIELYLKAFVAFASRCGRSLMSKKARRVSELITPHAQVLIPALNSEIVLSPNADKQSNLLWMLSAFPWEPSRREMFDCCMSNSDLAVTVLNCLTHISADAQNHSCSTLNNYYLEQVESIVLSQASSPSLRSDALRTVAQFRRSQTDATLAEKVDVLFCRALRVPASASIATDVLLACGDAQAMRPIFLNAFSEDEKVRLSAYRMLQNSSDAAAIRALWVGLESDRPEEQEAALTSWLRNPRLNPILLLSQILVSPTVSQRDKLGIFVTLLVQAFDDLVSQSFRAFARSQFRSKTAAEFLDRFESVKQDDLASVPAFVSNKDTKVDTQTELDHFLAEVVYKLGDKNLIEAFRRIVARADQADELIKEQEARRTLDQENQEVLQKFLERKASKLEQ